MATTVTIEELEIKVKAEVAKALQALDKVISKIKDVSLLKMDSAINASAEAFKKSADSIVKAQDKVSKSAEDSAKIFKKALDGIDVENRKLAESLEGRVGKSAKEAADVFVKKFNEAEEAARALAEEEENINAVVAAAVKRDKEAADALRERAEAAKDIPIRYSRMRTSAESLAKTQEEIKRQMDAFAAPAEKTADTIAKAIDETEKKIKKINISEILKKINSVLAVLAKTASKAFSAIGKGAVFAGKTIGKIFSVFGKIRSSLKLFDSSARKSTNTVSKFAVRIKDLVVAAFVFNIIRRGLRQLVDYFNSVLKANDKFAKSLNSIKVNAMTAFQPLYEFALPAINALMSAVSKATAYIAAFTSALAGKTYAESKAAAKALNQNAEAIKDTGKKAKDAGKGLQSFDSQLNILTSDTADDAASNIGEMFDEAETPQIDFSWIDEFKNKLLDIAPDLEYFFDVGASIGQKITEGFEKVPWDKIQDYAGSIVQKLAAFLNGAVTGLDFTVMGNTLAQGINTLLIIGYDFLSTFDFLKFGQKIGEGLNSLFDNVNFELLGAFLAEKFNALLDILYGIATSFDFTNAGQKIGEGINSLFDNVDWDSIGITLAKSLNSLFDIINNIIAKINWAENARLIADGLQKLTDDIKWADIGSTLGKGITGALTFLYVFLTSYDWLGLGLQFASLLNNAITKTDWDLLGRTIGALFMVAIDFLFGAVSKFDWISLGLAASSAINGFVEKIEWGKVGQIFSDAIKGILDSIFTLIEKTDWYAMGQSVKEFLINIDWNGIVQSFFRTFGAAFAGFSLLVYGIFEDAINGVINHFTKWIDLFKEEGMGTGAAVILGILAGIGDAVIGIGKWIWDNVCKPVVDGFKSFFKIASPSKLMSEMGTNIIEGLINGILGMATKLKEKAAEVVGKIVDAGKAIFDKVKTVGGDIMGKLKDGIDGAKTKVESAAKTVMTGMKSTIENMKSTFKTVGGNMMDGLKDGISNAANAIATAAKNVANAAVNGVKSLLGIHSPSKVFAGIGANLGKGFINGIESTARAIDKSIDSVFGVLAKDQTIKYYAEMAQPVSLPNPSIPMLSDYASQMDSVDFSPEQNILYDTVVEANSVLAIALSEFARQIVTAIKENRPVAKLNGKDIFEAYQEGANEYKRMFGTT